MGWRSLLIMTANDFISVATQLLAGDGEGRFRSAVSRGYYGAFHIARQFLFDCGVLVPIDLAVHRNVRWCLANSAEPRIVDASRLLESLRRVRNDADYNLSSTRFNDRAAVKKEVQRAAEISALLSPYQSESEISRVSPKIRAYAVAIGLLLRS